MCSFDGTVCSQMTTIAAPVYPMSQAASCSRPANVLCRVFVPGIGWGNQMASGEVLVQFADCTELAIQSSPMLVKFKEASGQLHKYVIIFNSVSICCTDITN